MVHPVDAAYKSFEFLIENLTERQVIGLRLMGTIPVIASDDSQWLIIPSFAQQSYCATDDTFWCLSPKDKEIPFGDALLAIVLMLENDVEDFRATARCMENIEGIRDINSLVHAHHAIFNSVPLSNNVKEFFGTTDKEWDDIFSCEDDKCNPVKDRTNVCDFHRGTNTILEMLHEINRWRDTAEHLDLVRDGLHTVHKIHKYKDLTLKKDDEDQILLIYNAMFVFDPVIDKFLKDIARKIDEHAG